MAKTKLAKFRENFNPNKMSGKIGVDKELRSYICDWPGCGYEFEQWVGEVHVGRQKGDLNGGQKSMVRCPNCNNFLPTDKGQKSKKNELK